MTFDKISDTRVTYTGQSIPELGIEKGKQYDAVIAALAHGVEKLATENHADVSCISGACDGNVPLQKAVEVLRDAVCNMSTDNQKTTASLFGINNNVSVAGSSLPNSFMTYSAQVAGNGLALSWNMGQIVNSLPAGYVVQGANVTAFGSGQNNNVLGTSSQTFGGLQLPLTGFPVTVDFTLRIGTPQGSVDLKRSVPFSGANPTGGTVSTQLLPTGSTGVGIEMTQKQYNEILASAVANQQKMIDSLIQQIGNGTSV
jgi:hypothetical protein